MAICQPHQGHIQASLVPEVQKCAPPKHNCAHVRDCLNGYTCVQGGYSAPLRAKANGDKCKALVPRCADEVVTKSYCEFISNIIYIADILVLPSAVALRDESSMTLKVDLFWSTQVAATRSI